MLAILFFSILFLVYKLNNYARSLSCSQIKYYFKRSLFLLLFLFRFLSLLTTFKVSSKIELVYTIALSIH